jgi:hypothetical protein
MPFRTGMRNSHPNSALALRGTRKTHPTLFLLPHTPPSLFVCLYTQQTSNIHQNQPPTTNINHQHKQIGKKIKKPSWELSFTHTPPTTNVSEGHSFGFRQTDPSNEHGIGQAPSYRTNNITTAPGENKRKRKKERKNEEEK